MKRQTYTIPEAARVLGIGRNAAYDAVKRGDLPVIRFGPKRFLIPCAALQRFLENAGTDRKDHQVQEVGAR